MGGCKDGARISAVRPARGGGVTAPLDGPGNGTGAKCWRRGRGLRVAAVSRCRCCRCNTQDYMWHKGTRCESIITDFQVMCVAVGSAALVLLLLFMMTVFFAKKLYLLKTENSKLRRTK